MRPALDVSNIEHALRIMEMTGDPIDKVLVKERAIDSRTFSECLKRHTEATVYRAIALMFYFVPEVSR